MTIIKTCLIIIIEKVNSMVIIILCTQCITLFTAINSTGYYMLHHLLLNKSLLSYSLAFLWHMSSLVFLKSLHKLLYGFEVFLLCNNSYWPQYSNVRYLPSIHALTACITSLGFFLNCWYLAMIKSCYHTNHESKFYVIHLWVNNACF